MAIKQPILKPSLLGYQYPEGGRLCGSGFLSVGVLCDFMRESLIYPKHPAINLTLAAGEPQDLQRKVSFRLYPNASELLALNKTATAHCKIYNTLLETSRLRYKAGLPAYTRTTVCEAVKAIRNAHPWIEASTTAQSAQVTGQRLVLAFKNFFDRVAKGQTPGYPRFKSYKKYPGWGYKTYGDGWSLLSQKSKTNAAGRTKYGYGAVRLTDIGNISIRGAARFLGIPKTAEIMRKGDKWYLSVTVNVTQQAIGRVGGNESMAFDWGLATLLTQVVGDPMTGAIKEVDNPRWLKNQIGAIAQVQKTISKLETAAKAKSGKDKHFPVCHQLKLAYARRRSIYGRVARQRGDFYHQLTAKLVGQYGLIVTEELAIKNMTKAPKAKPELDAQGNETGAFLPNGAAAKAGLNRSILDAAPAGLLAKLQYKALEAGTKFLFVPTRKVKPTQRCHQCGGTTKLTMDDRQWTCSCGVEHERDENAARTMIRYAFEGAWWESKDSTGSDKESVGYGQELTGSRKATRNSIEVGSPIWVE